MFYYSPPTDEIRRKKTKKNELKFFSQIYLCYVDVVE